MERTTKLTPAPKRISVSFGGAAVSLMFDDVPVLAMPRDDKLREADANVRLIRAISAAPELLEACRYIVDAAENGDEMAAIEKARAAIKKATGA